ncbi:MAG: Hsp20/alpha crystallin family protein [Candidatus Omnitrophota bacterium]
MKKTVLFVLASAVILTGIICLPSGVSAEDNINALKSQIEALQKRVEELESASAGKTVRPQTAIDRWDPIEEMDRMQREMNRMFRHSFFQPGFSGHSGLLNSHMFYDEDFAIKDNKDHYLISLDIKNFDKDKIDIRIDQQSITISGQQTSESEENAQNGYYSSRTYGSFLRTLPLPVDADTPKAQTKQEGGELIIKIPKKT